MCKRNYRVRQVLAYIGSNDGVTYKRLTMRFNFYPIVIIDWVLTLDEIVIEKIGGVKFYTLNKEKKDEE